MFREEAGHTEEEEDGLRNWVTDGPDGNKLVDPSNCIRFLLWIHLNVVLGTAGFTTGIWSTALKACKWWFDIVAQKNGLDTTPRGYITTLGGIAKANEEMNKMAKVTKISGGKDIQANIADPMSADEILGTMRFLYAFENPVGFNLTALMTLNTLVEFSLGLGMLSRGEEFRFLNMGCIFTKLIATIGANGLIAFCIISSCGKVNDSGRLTHNGVLRHRNPLRCAVAALGMLLLYRTLSEPSPDFLNSKLLYGTALLRSPTSSSVSSSYKTQYDNIVALFMHLRLNVQKATHAARIIGHQILDAAGVNLEYIKRLASRIKDATHDSYITNLPIPALLGAAGCDHEHPRTAQAAHWTVEPSPLLMAVFVPWLQDQQAKVNASREEALGIGHAEMERRFLYTASGSISAYTFAVTAMLQVAAARPRDKDGHIIADSLPMYKLFPNNFVYKLAAFQDQLFTAFVAKVRSAEDAEIKSPMNGPTGSLTPIGKKFQEYMQPGLQAILLGQQQQQAQLTEVVAEMREMKKREAPSLYPFQAPRVSTFTAVANAIGGQSLHNGASLLGLRERGIGPHPIGGWYGGQAQNSPPFWGGGSLPGTALPSATSPWCHPTTAPPTAFNGTMLPATAQFPDRYSDPSGPGHSPIQSRACRAELAGAHQAPRVAVAVNEAGGFDNRTAEANTQITTGEDSGSTTGSKKRKRASRDRQVDFNAGNHSFMQMHDHKDVSSLWTEYTTGINGRPSLLSLEKLGKNWRNYGSMAKRWSAQRQLYCYIERRIPKDPDTGPPILNSVKIAAEAKAIAELQAMITYRGASTSPDWQALMKHVAGLEESQSSKLRRRRVPVQSGSEDTGPAVDLDEEGVPLPDDGPAAVYVTRVERTHTAERTHRALEVEGAI